MADQRLADADAAIEKADKVTKVYPDFYLAYVWLGLAYVEKGKFQEAVSVYQQAAQKNPRSAEAQHGLGLALVGLNRYQESLAAFQAAVRLQPTWARAHANLGVAYLKLKRWREAAQALQTALKHKTDMRTAAYVVAINRVASACKQRGWV